MSSHQKRIWVLAIFDENQEYNVWTPLSEKSVDEIISDANEMLLKDPQIVDVLRQIKKNQQYVIPFERFSEGFSDFKITTGDKVNHGISLLDANYLYKIIVGDKPDKERLFQIAAVTLHRDFRWGILATSQDGTLSGLSSHLIVKLFNAEGNFHNTREGCIQYLLRTNSIAYMNIRAIENDSDSNNLVG